MKAGVQLVDARAGYGPIEVLHGVTLSFPAGSTVALLGRNGAGKSTVLRALAGSLPLSSGSVRWNNDDVGHLSPYERATRGMTLIPDDDNVFATLSVRENLEVFAAGRSFDSAFAAFPELAALLDQRAATLSGGERQMLALSRAVLRPGTVILLDEVSRGLSPPIASRLADIITGLTRPDRVIVIVEQYLHDALRLADTIYILRRGEVVFAGEPTELTELTSSAT
jgi:branched-chain amino acid transport system ATP-binding protein